MELKLNKELISFDVNAESGNPELKIGNDISNYKVKKTGDNSYSVFFNGKYINSYVAEDEKIIYVSIEGRQFSFEKITEDDKSFGGADAGSFDKEVIIPPMPGSIVKVLVEKGQKVKTGDALIIVEAMKMETSLYSSIDGIVTEINVKNGEQVGATDELAVIEKEKSAE